MHHLWTHQKSPAEVNRSSCALATESQEQEQEPVSRLRRGFAELGNGESQPMGMGAFEQNSIEVTRHFLGGSHS